ncbi:hypothetical protein OG440_21305 [Streptomyces sp. NBC_00637]|uniref:hypothetical protein n=1 Tax=Streptomyces sp. NBC_00637 TaxID=2903667 RepID=UPI00324E5124
MSLMNRARSTLTGILGASVLLAGALVGVSATSASAAEHCRNNTAEARSWAASGQFETRGTNAWYVSLWVPAPGGGFIRKRYLNKVELRYNRPSRCVWGLWNGAGRSRVYLDISSNGGRTWDGPLGLSKNATSAYTGTFNDRNLVARACVQVDGVFHCTPWW